MKLTASCIALSIIFCNPVTTMDTPGNSCLLMRLPGDMKRKIEKLVQEKQLENKQHPIAVPKNIATELPEGYIKSNTWNKFGPANWHYIWNRTIPGQIALYRVCQSGDLTKLYAHESVISLSTQSSDLVTIQADGPNNTNDLLIAGHCPQPWPYTIYFYLKKLTSSQNKTIQKCPQGAIPGQRLVTMALAAYRAFAILGKEPNNCHILSWYTYNENRMSHLANRAKLPGPLTKVAFVSPRAILGLTIDKRLVSLWLDTQNQLKFQLHKTPFAVEKFVIDSQNSDLIAFTYQGTEKVEIAKNKYLCGAMHPPSLVTEMKDEKYFAVAVSSLKMRDKKGKCPFKTQKLKNAPKTLEFADGVVVVTHEGGGPEIEFPYGSFEKKQTDEAISLQVSPTLFKQFISQQIV